MALEGRQLSQLTAATVSNDIDLFLTQQGGISKQITGELVREPIIAYADATYLKRVDAAPYQSLTIGGNLSDNPWGYGTTLTAVANNQMIANRIRYKKTGTMMHTASQQVDAPTFSQANQVLINSLDLNCTTAQTSLGASDYAAIQYIVEGYDWTKIAQNAFILPIWVKAKLPGIYCAAFSNDGDDHYYIAEYTINAADTWELKVLSVPASPATGTWNYSNGKGLVIKFVLAAGVSLQGVAGAWTTGSAIASANQVNSCATVGNYLRIAKFEMGSANSLSGFTEGSISDVQHKCNRYVRFYSEGVGGGTINATSFNLYQSFGVTMRAAPVLSLPASTFGVDEITGAGTSTVSSATITATNSNPEGFAMDITCTATPSFTGGKMLYLDNASTIALIADAEL